MTTPEKSIRRESIFLRVLWMLLFLLVWQVAVPLLGILVVAQLLYRLFYGAPSVHFMNFGDSLSQYLAQIGRFSVFNTDAKPWPVADWPQAHAADGEAAHVRKNQQAAPEAPVSAAPVSVVTPEPVATTDEVVEATETPEKSEVAEEPKASDAADAQSTEEQAKAVNDQQPKDETKS